MFLIWRLLVVGAALIILAPAFAFIRGGYQPAPALPSGVTLQASDGETLTSATTQSNNYYSSHGYTAASAWDSPSFFPVGPWESACNSGSSTCTNYAAIGMNTLWSVDGTFVPSVARGLGLSVIQPITTGGTPTATPGTETVGLLNADEPPFFTGTVGADISNTMLAVANATQDTRFWFTNFTWNWLAFGNITTSSGNPATIPNTTVLATLNPTPNSSTRHIDNQAEDIYWMVAGREQTGQSGATNGTTASGNAVLHFAATPAMAGGGGITVTDVTTPTAIQSGTTVSLTTGTTVTMSKNAAGAGVGSGDTILFSNQFFNNEQMAIIYGQGAGGSTPAQTGIGAHYGDMVDLNRALQTGVGRFPAPIYQLVETGGPNSQDETTAQYITPPELNWAVWASIIHGARGIAYFDHTFAGPFISDAGLVDSGVSAWFQTIQSGQTVSMQTQVSNTNALIASLAPVINSPFALGYASVSPAGWQFGQSQTGFTGFEIMTKYYNGHFYIFAEPRYAETTANQTATFTLAGSPTTTVTVLNESRSINVTAGTFTDTFALGSTIHIYEVN